MQAGPYTNYLMIIQYGFADNVEEELLKFDAEGKLESVVKGAKEKRQLQKGGLIDQFKGGEVLGADQMSFRTESVINGGGSKRKRRGAATVGESSVYSQSQPGNPDYDEDEEEDDEDEDDEDDEDVGDDETDRRTSTAYNELQ